MRRALPGLLLAVSVLVTAACAPQPATTPDIQIENGERVAYRIEDSPG